MLQQATELCFRSMSWALLSLDKRTHSISGLMKLNRRLAPQMNAVFPCDSKEEDRLLQLLEDAYIDARYKKDYEIAEDDGLILIARAGDLLELTKQIFDEKLARLDNIAVMEEQGDRRISNEYLTCINLKSDADSGRSHYVLLG